MKMHIEEQTIQEPEPAQEPRTGSGVAAAAEAGTVDGTRTGAATGGNTGSRGEVVVVTRAGIES